VAAGKKKGSKKKGQFSNYKLDSLPKLKGGLLPVIVCACVCVCV
jgi:hypothetical protein